MKIAIVCDWLVTLGGAEKVLEEMLRVFPQADLFALVEFLSPEQKKILQGKTVNTSFIQKIPFAKKYYRQYLPLMPLAVEQFDFSAYDVVLSSSHAVAKGILTGPHQIHISYTHSPMRYAWDLQHQYLNDPKYKGIKGLIIRYLLHRLRLWDFRSAQTVDQYLANSAFIAKRILKVYRREAKVIYPPVDVSRFDPYRPKDNFYFTASRFVPYKRIDLIVEAFKALPHETLIVIGDGPEFDKVKKIASPNVKLLGYQSNEVLKDYLERARAFIFAAEEDFGILPLEAAASGTPVIAYGRGGALETVRGHLEQEPTGVFFYEQTVEGILQGIKTFQAHHTHITPQQCRKQAEQFTPEKFREALKTFVDLQFNSH